VNDITSFAPSSRPHRDGVERGIRNARLPAPGWKPSIAYQPILSGWPVSSMSCRALVRPKR
jgi:hypothetical protein